MATSALSTWDGWCASQLMIVLLGGRNSAKHSLGNSLLGKEEFVTKERTRCSRRLGLVAGRRLTVVDTPGWWCDFSIQDTPELVKREILNSVGLCSPGPHVFLITVKSSSAFSEKRRRAVEEHVSLLGDGVWNHCMIVLTSDDRSQHCVAEERLQAGGKALRWLSEKCNRRCHSVNLRDDAGVKELLDKIEKLVVQNGSGVFKLQEIISQGAVERKRHVEARAQRRFIRMKEHRALMRERLRPITNIRMVLLGAKGSGKTSSLNTILNRETGELPRRTARRLVGSEVVFGRRLTVVDTPGWWMNYFSDESSVFDRREMVLSLSLCPPGPQVFLLVVRADRAFTETYRRAALEHLQLIGDRIWGRVMVLFTFGDWLGGTAVEVHIESEGEPLQWLVDKCGNRYHVLNNKTKGGGFQVRELIGKVEEMLAGYDSGWHYEIEKDVMEQLQVEMGRQKQRAERRLAKKKKQSQMARAQLEKLSPLPEMRLVLVGGRKTGKSSCGNTILKTGSFATDAQSASCTEKQGRVSGRVLTVLDTPCCFPVTPELLTGSCAVLLVVNVSSSFRGSHWEAIEKQLESGGGLAWSRAVVLFSHGDRLGSTSVEERIESEGELLRRLVGKCGNRYHVLDNKRRGDGAQVAELIDLMEEMLVGERLAVLHRGDHLWKIVSSAREELPEAATIRENNFKAFRDRRHQLFRDWTDPATSSSCPSLNLSEGPDASGQIVALSPGGAGGQRGRTPLDRLGFMTRSASIMSREALRWTTAFNPPVWFPLDNPRGQAHPLSPTRPTVLLVLPQTEHRVCAEESVVAVQPLCRPALRDQTLRRLCESGDLQALIEQWGDSSLEELEAFIDSYFEVVWDQTRESCGTPGSGCLTVDPDAVVVKRAEEEEVLSSINRKLSKLELLDEIRSDLVKLRDSLEHSWKAVQELSNKTKQDADNTG